MPLLDLPDPEKGRQMFEGLYGPERGQRRFRAVLKVLVPLAIIAAVLFLAAQITGSWTTIYSSMRGLFSTASTPPATPGQVSTQPQGCIVSGGTNYGKIDQACK